METIRRETLEELIMEGSQRSSRSPSWSRAWSWSQSHVSDSNRLIKLNLPLSWRTCVTRCGRSRWGSQRWRNKVSERVCHMSWSIDPLLSPSSEERRRQLNRCTSHTHTTLLKSQFKVQEDSYSTYSTQIPGARCGVETEEKPGDGDHVVLNKRLSHREKWLWWTLWFSTPVNPAEQQIV